MLYFSSLLKSKMYEPANENLFTALKEENIPFEFLNKTKDIWVRDYMPIGTKSGKYISFRYEPKYLEHDMDLKTDYHNIQKQVPIDAVFSTINLDGGNVVFSPSKNKAIISDRVFSENPDLACGEIIEKLENLLQAKVILIPSAKSDMTGHADGMVRFIDENTVIVNESKHPFGFENRIKKVLKNHNLKTMDFPYFETKKKNKDGVRSAEGCYINFLETESTIFMPIFGCKADKAALTLAKTLQDKKVVGVNINEIALHGGLLNCISWEI